MTGGALSEEANMFGRVIAEGSKKKRLGGEYQVEADIVPGQRASLVNMGRKAAVDRRTGCLAELWRATFWRWLRNHHHGGVGLAT